MNALFSFNCAPCRIVEFGCTISYMLEYAFTMARAGQYILGRAGNTMLCQWSFVSCPWAEENGEKSGRNYEQRRLDAVFSRNDFWVGKAR